MVGPKMGSWWVICKSDLRWDKSGRACGLVMLGGPQEMQEWIRQCTMKYGEPPEDIEIGFVKD